jgi:hypothetical protein
MGKRYADTKLHRKVWFRKLPLALREAWRILCAECDVIGVWEIDLDSLNLWIDPLKNGYHNITLQDLVEAFDLKVIDEDKVWIPGFVPFQYGDEAGVVSWKNKLRPKIVRMLEARGLPLPQIKDIPHVHNGHPPSISDVSPTHGVKEEEEDKDKVEDKEINPEEGSGEKPVFPVTPPGTPYVARPPRPELEIKTLDDLRRKIPLIYREKWGLAYPAPGWLDQQISLCFDFHAADPVQRPRTTGQWVRKLVTWLENGWAKRQAGATNSAEVDAKILANWGKPKEGA